jgi:hypothetical protein
MTVSTSRVDFHGYSDCIQLDNGHARVILGHHCGGRVLEYSVGGENAMALNPEQAGWTRAAGGAAKAGAAKAGAAGGDPAGNDPAGNDPAGGDTAGNDPAGGDTAGNAIDPWGGRFDIGPEKVTAAHPTLWLGPWSAEVTDGGGARLTSDVDPATGVRLVRDFALADDSSRLTCTQTIRNESGGAGSLGAGPLGRQSPGAGPLGRQSPGEGPLGRQSSGAVSPRTLEVCYWGRTFVPGGGVALVPLTEPSRFPNGYVMYGADGTTLDFAPSDPAVVVSDGMLQVIGTPLHPKLGVDSTAGWLAYLLPSGGLFVKRFPVFPDRVYNEVAGLTVSLWCFEDQVCEIEPIGPRERLAPGEQAAFTEEWWLLAVPEAERGVGAGASVDLTAITARVARETA